MKPLASAVASAAFLLGAVDPAHAQPVAPPFVTPQRDVDVTYLISAPGQVAGIALTQRMRWSATLWRQRLDPPGIAYMVTDYRSQTLLMVDPVRHAALLLPAPANTVQPPGVRAAGVFARMGEQIVAGTSCTEWRTHDDSGAASEVCLTADGVTLRARRGARILIEATQIRYAPQDASLFGAPPGTQVRTVRSH